MGAKTADQLNRRRPTVSCDICGRKFLNIQALKSHHSFLHANASDPKRVTPKQKQAETRQKKAVPVTMLKRVIPSPETQQANKSDVKDKSVELAGKVASAPKKPVFECPICVETFPVYFTAFRHIQKNHCVDENGQKVTANSPLLVKPIRIEVCATCNKEIRSTVPHTCPKQVYKDHYVCAGCEQVFSGLILFQHHVKGLHAEGAQNYFFPSREEFTAWKEDLEKQTGFDFVRLNQHKSKEIYHCSHQPTTVTTATKLCPASITIREYTKGVHVCFYKEHCGHTVNNEPLQKYDQYSISIYLRETEELKLEAEDDNDLYLQFKKMITCIVYDAAKVDITTLKELLGKALEMTSIIKHFDGEEQSEPLISKCLSDSQISRTLESLKPNQKLLQQTPEIVKLNLKRKLSPLPKETKKVEPKKAKRESPIEKLVENGVNTRILRKDSSPALIKSVSFNKSVSKKNEESLENKSLPQDKNTIPQENKSLTQEKKALPQEKKSLPLEKKSLPQEKKTLPQEKKSLPQEKKSLLLEKKPLPQEKKPLPQEKKKTEESAPTTPVQRSLLQSPSSFNDSYKHFVDQNFKCLPETSTPKPKTYARKREVVKTKIGQFKVKSSTLSPKDTSPAQKDSSIKDTSQKDSLIQDTSQKDSSIKDTSQKVSSIKDTSQKVSSIKDTSQKVSAIKDTSQKVSSIKVTPQRVSSVKVTPQRVSSVKVTPQRVSLKATTPSAALTKRVKVIRKVSNPKKFKAVPDVKYEVKEQENDCNILILKI